MSLLRKASIVTTPTAYENGKILSVKPAKTFGSELVTNGGFDTDLSGWAVDSGVTFVLDNTNPYQGNNSVLFSANSINSAKSNQTITTVVGKTYLVSAVVKYNSGDRTNIEVVGLV
jgi:hypothetical protein